MRLQIEDLTDNCFGCTACMAVCPVDAIGMAEGEGRFLYPHIDKGLCIECRRCEEVCPALRPPQSNHARQVECRYGRHVGDAVRERSSSGGAFRALADAVLSSGGVVFGAAYCRDGHVVRHDSSQRVGVEALMRSKYVQSDTVDTFREVGALLAGGTPVLYCGAPCQIAGLRAYLDTNSSDLLTVDFVCHGVAPAPLLREHLESLERRFGSTIVDVNFRPKTVGWQPHALRIEFSNGRVYDVPAVADSYFRGFLTESLFLRRSCYDCPFAPIHVSDVTLADFWGYRAMDRPELDDNGGISLVLLNSDGGATWLERASADFRADECPSSAAEYALAVRSRNADTMERRQKFLARVEEVGLEVAARETYMRGCLTARLKYCVKKILHATKRREALRSERSREPGDAPGGGHHS